MKAVQEKKVQQSSLKTILETLDQDQVSFEKTLWNFSHSLLSQLKENIRITLDHLEQVGMVNQVNQHSLFVSGVTFWFSWSTLSANVEPSANKKGILLALLYCHHRECHRSPGWGSVFETQTLRREKNLFLCQVINGGVMTREGHYYSWDVRLASNCCGNCESYFFYATLLHAFLCLC